MEPITPTPENAAENTTPPVELRTKLQEATTITEEPGKLVQEITVSVKNAQDAQVTTPDGRQLTQQDMKVQDNPQFMSKDNAAEVQTTEILGAEYDELVFTDYDVHKDGTVSISQHDTSGMIQKVDDPNVKLTNGRVEQMPDGKSVLKYTKTTTLPVSVAPAEPDTGAPPDYQP